MVGLSASSLYPLSHASIPTADLQATILPDYLQISLNLHLFQNLTELESSFSLPSYNGTLTGANATGATSSVQASIQGKVPSATVSDFALQLSSTPLQN